LCPLIALSEAYTGKRVQVILGGFLGNGFSGKYTRDTEFPEDDHRNYNRATGPRSTSVKPSRVSTLPPAPKLPRSSAAWCPTASPRSSPVPFRGAGWANAAAGAMYDVGTGLATSALALYDRYFREASHPRW
jgi:hypothetical protein